MANFPVIGGLGAVEDVQSGTERTINCFPEKNQGKTEWRLRNSPGLKPFVDFEVSGGIRAGHEVNGRAFVVAGTNFIEFYSDGSFTVRGALSANLPTPVSIDDNGLQIVMTDGLNAYVFTLRTNEFTKVTDEDWYPSKTVAVVDGYAVFARTGTGQYFHSDLYDALTYIPSDFASAETNPDILVAVADDPVGLLGLGSESMEVYWDTGDAEQVFARRQGAKVNLGCVAPLSVVTLDNGTIWVGADADGTGGVYRVFSGTPSKISTIPVDELLDNNDLLRNATAFGYKQAGHSFYCLNIPGVDSTLVFDLTTLFWHERRSFDEEGNWGRWLGERHVAAFGKNFVGDYGASKLYQLDLRYFFDGESTIIRRERDLAPVFDSDDSALATYEGLTLDVITGEGHTNPPYDDPQLILQISRDGGHTYSSERSKPVGKKGEYKRKLNFRRLGISRDTRFRVVYTYPTPFAIHRATINARR